MAARTDRKSGKTKNPEDHRSESQRDRDRVLYSAAFRRLGGITQVASASEGHFFHNRLTHSLKVAQVGRRVAERLRDTTDPELLAKAGGLDPDVVETAGLLHDIGHPPFGHLAEHALQELGKPSSISFEGNAQTFRVATVLALRKDGAGLDLTRATLNAIIKYPWARDDDPTSKRHWKWAFYSSERPEFDFARAATPSAGDAKSLEAELMDLADDVTYAVHDVDDFYRAGLVPLHALLQPTEIRERYLTWLGELEDRERNKQGRTPQTQEERASRRSIVTDLFDEVGRTRQGALLEPYAGDPAQVGALAGFTSFFLERFLKANAIGVSAEPPFLRRDARLDTEMDALKNLMRRFVYESPGLVAQQRGQQLVISTLFKVFCEAAVEQDLRALLPSHLHERAKQNGNSDAGAIRLAMDAITCLTEEQALRLYRRVSGLETGSLLDAHSRAL